LRNRHRQLDGAEGIDDGLHLWSCSFEEQDALAGQAGMNLVQESHASTIDGLHFTEVYLRWFMAF
jgi:hypothetical protein